MTPPDRPPVGQSAPASTNLDTDEKAGLLVDLSDDGKIFPLTFPIPDIDPGLITELADDIRTSGQQVSDIGSDITTAWARMPNHYQSSGDDEKLYAALDPVNSDSTKLMFGTNRLANALTNFAETVEGIQGRWDDLTRDADQKDASTRKGSSDPKDDTSTSRKNDHQDDRDSSGKKDKDPSDSSSRKDPESKSDIKREMSTGRIEAWKKADAFLKGKNLGKDMDFAKNFTSLVNKHPFLFQAFFQKNGAIFSKYMEVHGNPIPRGLFISLQAHTDLSPTKKPSGGELTEQHKANNTVFDSVRAAVERAVAHLKTWRMLQSRYRAPLSKFPEALAVIIGLYFYTRYFGSYE